MKRTYIRILSLLVACLILSNAAFAGNKRVLYIGDSITDGGWGRSGGMMTPSEKRNHKDLNHLYGHSFMMLCAAHYMSEYPDSDYVFLNRGISGNTLNDVAQRWQADALDLKPDVVTLLVGTNDIDRYLADYEKDNNLNFDYREWGKQYEQLLDQLVEQNPHVTILVGSPFVDKGGKIGKAPTFAKRQKMIRKLGNIIADIAKNHHAIYLPFREMFEQLTKTQPREHYWIWDGIHPTTAGHQRMADLWVEMADRMHVL